MAVRPGEEVVQTASKEVRVDIQLLRAWAVLTVIVNHARVPFLPGGFLGVDIFFVISGYLMTGLIDEGLVNRTFTFRGFYARRARRLLPAAYATLVVSALAAPLLLDALEYQAFVKQLAGAFAFVSNIVLWKQANYFGGEAVLKPLLHMWSLSLEEQYYLLLPPALFFCARRFRLALSAAVVLVSGALCVAAMGFSATAAFYFLPTRAWELALGSVVAMLVRGGHVRPARMTIARLAALAVILVLPFAVGEGGHPGWPAVAACLGTALLLVPGLRIDGTSAALRPLVGVGNRSYSLYLTHWAPLAFAANVFAVPVPLTVNLALLALGVAWAEWQYRFVEQPLRRFAMTRRSLLMLVALPVAVIGASVLCARMVGGGGNTADRAQVSGLSSHCDYRGDFVFRSDCATGSAPDTLVWGDSFAMSLTPGVAAVSPQGVVQATRTVCGPFLGLSPVNDGYYNRAWAQRCMSFNDSVLAYLTVHPEIDRVVLTSVFAHYFPGAEPGWRGLARGANGSQSESPPNQAVALAHLADTAARLRAIGKRVVLFAPPPSSDLDIGRCLARRGEGRPVLGGAADCSVSVADYRRHRAGVVAFIDAVRKAGTVPVIDFDAELCAAGRCRTRLSDLPLYRDKDHLSVAGSIRLAREMDWNRLIEERAR